MSEMEKEEEEETRDAGCLFSIVTREMSGKKKRGTKTERKRKGETT